jgi:hypothetical protein
MTFSSLIASLNLVHELIGIGPLFVAALYLYKTKDHRDLHTAASPLRAGLISNSSFRLPMALLPYSPEPYELASMNCARTMAARQPAEIENSASSAPCA